LQSSLVPGYVSMFFQIVGYSQEENLLFSSLYFLQGAEGLAPDSAGPDINVIPSDVPWCLR
jgi:hypothetical protein